LGFTFGPALGAVLSSWDLVSYTVIFESLGLNPYSASALLAFMLILIEIIYLYFKLPETHVYKPKSQTPSFVPVTSSGYQNLKQLSWIHFGYLFLFSGLEFTLPFLTYDRYQFTNVEQGKLLGYIGLVAALVQGGYTRRSAHRVGEKAIATQGLISCALGFFLLGLWPNKVAVLWIAATLLAFTSATVVTALTSLASQQCSEAANAGQKLGSFRSWGQLGRAAGPMCACAMYWICGTTRTYLAGTGLLLCLTLKFKSTVFATSESSSKTKKLINLAKKLGFSESSLNRSPKKNR
jgi:MFS family permease